MHSEITGKFTTTALTTDSDALVINSMLNDVRSMISVGKKLSDVFRSKFGSNNKSFNRWVKMNIDKDIKSVIRYMILAENEKLINEIGLIRLSEAYSMLGIDGNIDTTSNRINCD